MIYYCFWIKYNNIAYNIICIKKYFKNCVLHLENLTNKTLYIIEKHDQK